MTLFEYIIVVILITIPVTFFGLTLKMVFPIKDKFTPFNWFKYKGKWYHFDGFYLNGKELTIKQAYYWANKLYKTK